MQSKGYAYLTIGLFTIPLIIFTFYEFKYFGSNFKYIFSGGLLAVIVILLPLTFRISRKTALINFQVQDIVEKRNLVEAEMVKETLAIGSFKEKIVNYSKLKGLTERLILTMSLDDITKIITNEVNKLFGGKDSFVILYLFHSRTGELGLSSSQKGQMRVNIKSKNGDAFDQWLVKTMQPLLIENVKTDYRFDMDRVVVDQERVVMSLISVPLMVGNKALGILRIDSPEEYRFGTEGLRFLTAIGDLGAVAIENAQLYEHVEQLAIKDGLTGLYLKHYLMDRLNAEVSRQVSHKYEISFLMIDLDFFKQYNDKFGHTAGDIVLKTVAGVLSGHFTHPGNLICRYGGEEFSVMLPHCPKAKALELAEELRSKIEEQDFFLRREKTNITISIGVAAFPTDARTKERLIDKADQALYQAKEAGRNRVVSA